jgi:hypothetical protein
MATRYHALLADVQSFRTRVISECHVPEKDSGQPENCFRLPGCDSVQSVRELLTFRTNLLSQYITLKNEECSFTEASVNVYHYLWTFRHLKMRPLGCQTSDTKHSVMQRQVPQRR